MRICIKCGTQIGNVVDDLFKKGLIIRVCKCGESIRLSAGDCTREDLEKILRINKQESEVKIEVKEERVLIGYENIDLSNTDIPKTIITILNKQGIIKITDLLKYGVNEIENIKGMGGTRIKKIIEILDKVGIKWNNESEIGNV